MGGDSAPADAPASRLASLLGLALDASAMGTFEWHIDDDTLTWDERLLTLFGYDDPATFGGNAAAAFEKVHPDDLALVVAAMNDSVTSLGPMRAILRVEVQPGATRWVEVRGHALPGPDGTAARMLGVAYDVTDRLLAEARADRLLAEMPVAFALCDDDGRCLRVNAEFERLLDADDPAPIGRALWDLLPLWRDAEVADVLDRVRATRLARTVEAYHGRPLNRWFEVHVQPAELGVGLYLVDVTARHDTQERLRRTADYQRGIARTLQDALRVTLPESAHLDVRARYVPAVPGVTIGGDWYDLLVHEDGSATVIIGDVIGHDIAAAAAMGQMRGIARTLAWAGTPGPADLLSTLGRAVRDLRVDLPASLVVLHVAAGSGEDGRAVCWSNAGHPPPILVHPDGRTQLLVADRVDPLVSVAEPETRSQYSLQLPSDVTLVLYTDGLVDTREFDVDEGIERLRATLSRHAGRSTDQLLDGVLADLVTSSTEDDVAMLALRSR